MAQSDKTKEAKTSENLAGNTKVTRQDWLTVALDMLISDGIEQVKVLPLAESLDVSRSSFYWYFKSRQDLLDALLEHWMDTNTKAVIDHAQRPAQSIGQAILNVFVGFLDPDQFNNKLDFAIRDWARRSGKVRRIMDTSVGQRISALADMFERFDYDVEEALTRARVLYYMQIGYNDAELQEPMPERLSLLPNYLFVFSGVEADPADIENFRVRVSALIGVVSA